MTAPRTQDDVYRRLYDDAPCGFVSLDGDGVVTLANRTVRRWLGDDDLVGRPFADLLAPAAAAVWQAQVLPTARLHGGVRETPLELRTGAGTLPVLVTVHGGPDGWRLTVLDGRARKAWGDALLTARRDAERHAERVGAMSDAVAALATARRVEDVGAALAEPLGRAVGALDVVLLHAAGPAAPPWDDVLVRARADGLADVELPLVSGTRSTGRLVLRADLDQATAETALLRTRAGQVASVVERIALHEALRGAEERARTAFETAPVGMALLEEVPGPGLRLVRVNAALLDVVGHHVARGVGRVVDPATGAAHDRTRAALLAGGPGPTREARAVPGPDGTSRHVRVTVSRADGGAAPVVTLHVEDVAAEAELAHLSRHDRLTGLANRAELIDQLAGALVRVSRSGTHVALLVVDLDHFKDVNDSLGHEAGDTLLARTAARLAGACTAGDVVARLGGDEFAVVRGGLPADAREAAAAAAALAQRREEALERDVEVAGRTLRLSTCAGVAVGGTGDTAEQLLRDADAAVHRAKALGGARVRFADPAVHVRAMRQVELEAELRAALAGDEAAGTLRLVYQPAFGRGDDDGGVRPVRAVEALLRWDHPRLGTVGPGAFLDVAEERRLMEPLGGWVLDTACEQASRWQRRLADRAPQVWVNVSARQLGDRALARAVERALDRTGLPPHLLCVELTERQLAGTAEHADELVALAGLGVHLSLDDFGTGYAGLDYLRRLAFDVLKIDRSYVVGLTGDPKQATLAAGIVAIGRSLGLTVVAEGVETAEQLAQVEGLGCDLVQGFLLGRPSEAVALDCLLGIASER